MVVDFSGQTGTASCGQQHDGRVLGVEQVRRDVWRRVVVIEHDHGRPLVVVAVDGDLSPARFVRVVAPARRRRIVPLPWPIASPACLISHRASFLASSLVAPRALTCSTRPWLATSTIPSPISRVFEPTFSVIGKNTKSA